MKILILSCGTGEGHNSAARAVEENLLKRNIFCEVKDVVSFRSEKAQKKVSAKILSNFDRKIFDIVRTMIYNAFCLLNVNKKFK